MNNSERKAREAHERLMKDAELSHNSFEERYKSEFGRDGAPIIPPSAISPGKSRNGLELTIMASTTLATTLGAAAIAYDILWDANE